MYKKREMVTLFFSTSLVLLEAMTSYSAMLRHIIYHSPTKYAGASNDREGRLRINGRLEILRKLVIWGCWTKRGAWKRKQHVYFVMSFLDQKYGYFFFLLLNVTIFTKICQNMEKKTFQCIENEQRSYFII